MGHDTTDSDADGTVESDVDNSSVSTNSVTTGEVTLSGTTRTDWPSGTYSDTDARNAVEGNTDVADLSGALGSSGQIPESDGTGVSWVDAASGGYTDEQAQDTVFNNLIGGTDIGVNYEDANNQATVNFTGTASSADPTVYTTQYSGTDASARFQNAVNDLDAGGTIVIPGAGSGNTSVRTVNWDSDITVNINNFNAGLTVHIQPGCRVDYTGTGVALFVRSGDGTAGSANISHQIQGGVFRFFSEGVFRSTNDPTGCLHLQDINQAEINVGTLFDWRNSNGDAYGMKISNWDRWSENNSITGACMNVDRGFVFDGFRSGSGNGTKTTSLQDQYIHGASVDQHYGIGFDMYADMSGTQLVSPTSMNYSADGVGYKFAGRCDNVVVSAPECEEFDSGGGSSTMFGGYTDEPVFGNGPVIINPGENLVTNVHDGNVPTMTRYMGDGIVMPTPDESAFHRIHVDNSGNVTASPE